MKVEELETAIGYSFRDKKLLKQALTLSFCDKRRNNQRLEFLGDSVLGLVISDYLYKNLPKAHEGILTRIKSYLVSRLVLYHLALRIGLDDILKLKFGMNKRKALADTMEAIIGAIYEDARDIVLVYSVVINLWGQVIDNLVVSDIVGPKERLQMYAQALRIRMPQYCVLEIKGPKHRPLFIVGVYIGGKLFGTGEGPSKKNAEKMAAVCALKNMGLDV